MKLWLVWQTVNNEYDTFSDAVVAAETEDQAKHTHPSSGPNWDGQDEGWSSWCGIENVQVKYLGEAAEGQMAEVICSSFHAG
jgi:hypothetical protein